MASGLRGTIYLQVKRDASWSNRLRIVKMTKRRPDSVEPGCRLAVVNLNLDARDVDPLALSVETGATNGE